MFVDASSSDFQLDIGWREGIIRALPLDPFQREASCRLRNMRARPLRTRFSSWRSAGLLIVSCAVALFFYSGGPYELLNATFDNCQWKFQGPANQTFQLLTQIGVLKPGQAPQPQIQAKGS